MASYEQRFVGESVRSSSSPLKYRASFESRRSGESSEKARPSYPTEAASNRYDSSRPLNSPRTNGTHSIVMDVQKQHEKTLEQVYTRMELSDRAYQAEVTSLQAQVASLRQQLELASVSHAREVEAYRRDFEERLRSETLGRESALTSLAAKTKETQHISTLESDRCAELRKDILTEKERHSDTMARLLSEQRAIQQEIDYYQNQKLPSMQSELDRLKDEKQRLAQENERIVLKMKEDHQALLAELQTKLEAKEAFARNLEYDAADLRHQIAVRTEANARDTAALQDTIKATRGVIDVQERDLARLKQARTEARLDSKELAREVSSFESEVLEAKSHNQQLRSDARKLERLVYGKTGRSPKPKSRA